MNRLHPLRSLPVRRLLPLALAAAVAQHTPAASAVSAIKTAWVDQTDPANSNANWPAGTAYTDNFGIAFITGSTSSSYTIDWLDIGLNTSNVTSGSGSLKVALHGTNNSTAYSAVASPTAYATDTVNFTMPTSTSTAFNLALTSAELPNITSYAMSQATAYALILYAPSVNIGMMRRSGYANGTTNNFYTVSDGFTMLGTLRNNSPNYSNNPSSYPSLDLAFGYLASPSPGPGAQSVPAPLGAAGLAALVPSVRRLRSLRRRLRTPR